MACLRKNTWSSVTDERPWYPALAGHAAFFSPPTPKKNGIIFT
jgi:hypothetical protein